MAAEREPLALLRESSAENPTLLGYEEMGYCAIIKMPIFG